MALKLVRIKLKDDSEQTVKDWASFMNAHIPEIKESLKSEGVTLEAYWLETTESGNHLIGLIRTDNIAQSQEASNNSAAEVDSVHRKFQQDSWESVEKLENLLEIDLCEEGDS